MPACVLWRQSLREGQAKEQLAGEPWLAALLCRAAHLVKAAVLRDSMGQDCALGAAVAGTKRYGVDGGRGCASGAKNGVASVSAISSEILIARSLSNSVYVSSPSCASCASSSFYLHAPCSSPCDRAHDCPFLRDHTPSRMAEPRRRTYLLSETNAWYHVRGCLMSRAILPEPDEGQC